MDNANPVDQKWYPSVTGVQLKRSAGVCTIVVSLSMPSDTTLLYGAPSAAFLNFTLDGNPLAPTSTLDVSFTWINKTATRMAEAAWLSFVPNVADPTLWRMDVLGYPVNPLEVVDMGTQHIHTVWDGVRYDGRPAGGAFVNIITHDSPLVSPGDVDHLLFYDGLQAPNMAGGWHFNLWNNAWGTAFPQWYGDNGASRFTLELQAPLALAPPPPL